MTDKYIKIDKRSINQVLWHQAGQTVVEVLLATAVVGMVLTAIAAGLSLSVKNTAESKYRSVGITQAQQALEVFRRERALLGWFRFHEMDAGRYCLTDLPSSSTDFLSMIPGECESGVVIAGTEYFREAHVAILSDTSVEVELVVWWLQGDKVEEISITQEYREDGVVLTGQVENTSPRPPSSPNPTPTPSSSPSSSPSTEPSSNPNADPSTNPSASPTPSPSGASTAPSSSPSPSPSSSRSPSTSPSPSPTPNPSPRLVLNSASGKSCTERCSTYGLSCASVGVDTSGTNAKAWVYYTNTCHDVQIQCGSTMVPQSQTCSGSTATWTRCNCQ